LTSIFAVFRLYPDVVFSKGGYASFPVLMAARLLFIPVVIHESDTVPGRVSLWAGKFAERIAISWPDAAKYFPVDKVALTGNPIRKDIAMAVSSGARDYLQLEEGTPIVLVLGGSQGASNINDAIIEALPEFVSKVQLIHQTGEKNFDEVKRTATAVLTGNQNRKRYKPFPYLDPLALRMGAGAASVVVSRAGSTIFEIASWQVPAILIPIPEPVSHDQTRNAFAFARAGGGEVIEEKNLTPHLLLSEIMRLIENPEIGNRMKEAQKAFQKPNAAHMVAEEILKIALKHEIKE
jgi:UDP-N-acetylglucosamine--N-acetylmuramyl-(pentapeptide) pyrophosphoryl-undecaprenol N-acetylglucosamine transferase